MDPYNVYDSRKKIIVPENWHRMDAAVIHFIRKRAVRKVGLDCEWTNDSPVSLIQIATEDHVILFQVCRFRDESSLPYELGSILTDQSLVKVGVNIEEDAKRLKDGFGILVKGWLDIRCFAIGEYLLGNYLVEQLKNYESLHCANNTCPSSVKSKRLTFMPKLGLDALVGACLGKSLKASARDHLIQAFGSWNSWNLSPEDEAYAAADAAASLDVFNFLASLRFPSRSLKYIETSYDHNQIKSDCLKLLSSMAKTAGIDSILPHYYGKGIMTNFESVAEGSKAGMENNAERSLLSYIWSGFAFLISCILMLLLLFFGVVCAIAVVHLMIEYDVISKTRRLVLKYLNRPYN